MGLTGKQQELTTLAAALIGLAALAGRSAEVGGRQPLGVCTLGLHGDGLAAVEADSILLLHGLDGLEDWRAGPLLRLYRPMQCDHCPPSMHSMCMPNSATVATSTFGTNEDAAKRIGAFNTDNLDFVAEA